MQVDDLPQVSPDVDYTEILPIQQKRTITFVNHFILNAVSYLNKFAQSCESRFMQFEYKMQKIEASLLILEAQLASIPGYDKSNNSTESGDKQIGSDSVKDSSHVSTEMKVSPAQMIPGDVELKTPSTVNDSNDILPKAEKDPVTGIKASEDLRYARFFKMLRVGVQEQAVKIKMKSEGFDPSILDHPDAIIPEPDSTQETDS